MGGKRHARRKTYSNCDAPPRRGFVAGRIFLHRECRLVLRLFLSPVCIAEFEDKLDSGMASVGGSANGFLNRSVSLPVYEHRKGVEKTYGATTNGATEVAYTPVSVCKPHTPMTTLGSCWLTWLCNLSVTS